MKPAQGLAVLVSFVLFVSLSAVAGAPQTDGVRRLMNDTAGAAKIRVDEETGQARFVELPVRSMQSASINNRAMRTNYRAKEFFREYSDAFGIHNVDTELREVRTSRDLNGNSHTVLAQSYEGVPVFGGELRAHFNRNGEMTAANGMFVSGLKLNTTPSIAADIAEGRAIRAVIMGEARKFNAGRRADDVFSSFDETLYSDLRVHARDLLVFREGLARGTPGADHLAYRVEVRNSMGTIREFVFIDAHSGKFIDQITGIYDALDRRAYDAESMPHPGPNYPDFPFWVEGDAVPTGNVEADNMIVASEETYDLFQNAFGRDSFDALGATMDAIFNRGDSCPNASWNGTYISFCPGLTSDDVTGHEWAHAYTEYTNNLIYQWQSGALNESYSDIWGEAIDLINGRGTDAPAGVRSDGACSVYAGGVGEDNYRWLMGEDVTTLSVIRDMWNPTCLGDPGKVSDDEYFCSAADNGGVHFNSGVPNHAFALLVDGGTFNGETISAIGLTKAAHIEWTAQNMLTPTSNFVDNADALEAACSALVGADLADLAGGGPSGEVISASDCDQVAKAITAVEMRLAPTQCGFEPVLQPDAPALCDALGDVQTSFSENFEGGSIPAGWTVSSYGVADPATFDSPGWSIVGDHPAGANGLYSAFAPDLVLGDCGADTEAGAITLESPEIVLPVMQVPHLSFDHYVASEATWDGGNLKVSVNGGPWTLVPASDYAFNPYNSGVGGDNPMAGEAAFSGANEGELAGSWGQSQVNLFGLALPGDTIKLRFDFGTDGCNGLDGWYIDDVHVYSCSAEPLPVCGDGKVEPGEMCDDGNSADGDGCSASCGVEEGWSCTSSTPASSGGNILQDWSFEGGVPNADWTPASTFTGIAGFPLCGPGNGCPAAGLASTGSWNAWIGGLTTGVTSSVTQSVVIPASATEITLQTLRGICDDPGDTIYVRIDGNEVGSVACDATDSDFVQYAFPLAPYNDNAMHDVYIGGTVGGTNGVQSNFFIDDVYIEGNVITPAKPSMCTRRIEDLSCNAGAAGFDNGVPDSWTVIDNEATGVVWNDIANSGIGGNFVGTEGDAASVSSDAAGPVEFDTELRSNMIDLRNAKSASVTYQVDYQNFGGLDFLDLDISTDGGASWATLLSWNEDHPIGGLFVPAGESANVDLSAYIGQKVYLRWRYYDPNSGDWDWYAQIDDVAVDCDVRGRMVGAGFVKQDNVKYHHGFALRCDDSAQFNWMQVRWGTSWRDRQKFKLQGLTSAACSDQPGIDAGWPKAPFDTFVGAGFGTLNGEPALIEFRISDAGEPGRNDEISYTITGENGVSVSGKLGGGNTQAKPLGQKWKP